MSDVLDFGKDGWTVASQYILRSPVATSIQIAAIGLQIANGLVEPPHLLNEDLYFVIVFHNASHHVVWTTNLQIKCRVVEEKKLNRKYEGIKARPEERWKSNKSKFLGVNTFHNLGEIEGNRKIGRIGSKSRKDNRIPVDKTR